MDLSLWKSTVKTLSKGKVMKNACTFCNAKSGKRFCALKEGLICSVCCAKNRDESTCQGCSYFGTSQEFENKKNEKATSKLSSVFGSPQMQKEIMEASIDLMNNHNAKGKEYDSDPDLYQNDAFTLFNTDEYSEFEFSEKEIKHIIIALGEPGADQSWFFSEEGRAYYLKAVEMTMNEVRFRTFSQQIFRIFLKYYHEKNIDTAWILLATMNRLMEGEFVLPFTILMFFRGLAKHREREAVVAE